MGQANTMGVVMDKLPRLSKIIGWFRGDEMNIDNHLFKLHYQVTWRNLVIVVMALELNEQTKTFTL